MVVLVLVGGDGGGGSHDGSSGGGGGEDVGEGSIRGGGGGDNRGGKTNIILGSLFWKTSKVFPSNIFPSKDKREDKKTFFQNTNTIIDLNT